MEKDRSFFNENKWFRAVSPELFYFLQKKRSVQRKKENHIPKQMSLSSGRRENAKETFGILQKHIGGNQI
ncbi:MAG: hypothetical protein UCN50_01945 [Anaerotignum sp.]|uniref:hypothetical protein n=1 Tax=Anaerotignum sp. TaxID=2039241 RepID=UPI002E76FB6C|nr:hypothetical protein [Anaerotignum sp.]MEE0700709.1 hypothetical protein [Anaerotignum sp.]